MYILDTTELYSLTGCVNIMACKIYLNKAMRHSESLKINRVLNYNEKKKEK